ncbi:MAG: tRNA (adenosine(37)-N6)-dimethylallyltransferase MiaA [Firmicutes bacterium]|nr:tRNA (adenosine(37)-N6)-dimethylallyltransferase MiaA [Bacillota bacterium]HOB34173.1 tRNA (adenosine(37)-N6)-dimethylallyltransferase MiaA [Bacillota bacterium]HPZ90047.1 tRNA (adenosine(37)-N6)-dimethylallyltransferase MiaA [Bacillota bacterium]HQE00993.1 tRNA (adenosine(37)-N6)-dimethylallyltransferase MiaA [Bacillota bacterium]
MAEKIPLLVIGGPTATGKSDVAVEVALACGGEVISADSMQVYKFMDIGTAKVDRATRARVPHHMLDIVEPDQDFSAALYKIHATAAARDIWRRGRFPIMAGGTGLYIRAVCENFPLEEMPYDPRCRAELNATWEARGREYMEAWLGKVDPESAARIKDRRRIIRALEIYLLTGQQPSVIQRHAGQANPFQPIIFALNLPRPKLYAKINARAESMIRQGLVGEYIELRKRGYSPHSNAMQGLGYRHCNLYLEGKWTLAEMVAHLQQDTRRYAKRQLTWFRGMQEVTWLDNSHPPATVERILSILQEIQAGKAK